ncbi:serum paraoxonase arylesterase 2, partial [Rhizoctonia solani]
MLVRWLSIAVALLAWYVWSLKHAIGAQLLPKRLPPLFSAAGKCKLIREKESGQFKFCEDGLVLAPGVSVFSCDPNRHEWNTIMGPMLDPSRRGSLWALHYTSTATEKPYPLKLTNFPINADFHPLGIELTPRDSAGTSRLLVINHRRQNTTIEVFRIHLESHLVSLAYETTLTHASFVAPNAIAAISPTQFFLSHDHYFTRRMAWPWNKILPPLETFLALPLSRVDLVSFETRSGTPKGVRNVQTVARNIAFANGVAVSDDGSTLAIASTTRAQVQLYSKDETSIRFVTSVRVPFSVDNIAFAGDELLTAGHPYLPEFMALVKRKSNRAPSYVSAIAPSLQAGLGKSWLTRVSAGANVTTRFMSDGSFLGTSSGAFADLEMQTMFVVALYGSGVAKCGPQFVPKNLPPFFNAGGSCELIREKEVDNRFKFCEDGVILAPGIAIFSCDLGRYEWNTAMGPMNETSRGGSLWALHYTSTTTEKPYPLELTSFPGDADMGFHPLGIDIALSDSAGTPSRLLVINHGRHKPTVEVFHVKLESGLVALTYETTLTHPSFVAPNAIAAVSFDSFFLSHDHYFTNRMRWPLNTILPWLETFLLLPLGKVDLISFEALPGAGVRKVQTVARNIACANGVAVSADGSTLAVASTARAEVLIYSKDKTTVKFITSIRVPFGVDNLAFAGDQLLAAGHPYAPELMALMKNKSSRAPSYVSAISPQSANQTQSWLTRILVGANLTTVFMSDGSFLSASSGASVDLEMRIMFVRGYALKFVPEKHVSLSRARQPEAVSYIVSQPRLLSQARFALELLPLIARTYCLYTPLRSVLLALSDTSSAEHSSPFALIFAASTALSVYGLNVGTPAELTQCGTVEVKWSGKNAPFIFSVLPSCESNSDDPLLLASMPLPTNGPLMCHRLPVQSPLPLLIIKEMKHTPTRQVNIKNSDNAACLSATSTGVVSITGVSSATNPATTNTSPFPDTHSTTPTTLPADSTSVPPAPINPGASLNTGASTGSEGSSASSESTQPNGATISTVPAFAGVIGFASALLVFQAALP